MKMNYHTVEITTPSLVRKFIKLPWEIYKGDPNWVPPLKLEMRQKLNPQKNPFFKYGSVKLFGVENENRTLVARGAAILNPMHNRLYDDHTGFFGLFECIDDVKAAGILIKRIADELQRNRCTHVLGPVNFSTNEESGFLIEGFGHRPMIMTNYCPPYYQELMPACGLTTAMDMSSYEWHFEHVYPDKLDRVIRLLSRQDRGDVHIRALDRKRLDEEVRTIREIYNSSFPAVWGFVPISGPESEEMAKSFKLFSDDNLILFAETAGKPVGFCLCLPDINEILKDLNGKLLPFGLFKFLMRRRRIRSARVLVLGVIPAYRNLGTAALLIHRLHETGLARGYRRGELSMVMESNHRMRQLLEALGFRAIKRFRVYQAALNHIFSR